MQAPGAEELKDIQKQAKAGRPRSEDSRRAILDATRRLLTHMSVPKISVEAIAKKAGVGKTTIYRWWPNKQAVVMEAVFNQPGFQNFLPHNVTPAEGIKAQIEKLARQLNGKTGRIVAEIIGECQGEPEILRALIANFFQDRYNALASYLGRGKQDGIFRADIDVEVAIDLIIGPVIFRLMSGQDLDDTFARRLTDMALNSLSVPQAAAAYQRPAQPEQQAAPDQTYAAA